MPENKTIHDLPIAEQTNASDVFETEIPSSLMQSGYASRKVTMSSLETHMLGTEQYETQLPNFPQGSRSVFTALEYARQSGGGGGASVIQKTMAEYTALPTSAKMNGSIYKITDKALIYCLDEEFHALKEITSADYAQLTPAEQNNGTIYVKTDEETQIQDLGNVTLTTSDNNKLLGVSVIGDDISVGAVSYMPTMGGRSTTPTSDLTGSLNTPNTLFTDNITINSKSTVYFQYRAIMKTSGYTGRLTLVIDNVEVANADMDLTAWMQIIGNYTILLDSGSHSVSLKLTSTNAGSTATIKAWNTYGYTFIATPTM